MWFWVGNVFEMEYNFVKAESGRGFGMDSENRGCLKGTLK